MAERDVPEGAAVFPMIPEDLGISPLFLAVLHAYVFLEGSDETVLDPDSAEEGLEYFATYLQRLSGKDLSRVREDLETLVGFAKEEKWPKEHVMFLQNFLKENGVAAG
jgi:hypothetical protein